MAKRITDMALRLASAYSDWRMYDLGTERAKSASQKVRRYTDELKREERRIATELLRAKRIRTGLKDLVIEMASNYCSMQFVARDFGTANDDYGKYRARYLKAESRLMNWLNDSRIEEIPERVIERYIANCLRDKKGGE